MSLADRIFIKQRIEQLQQISERRNLTGAEAAEYENLVQKDRDSRRR
jgi:hypothetical protein